MHSVDSLWYHLPFAARWVQTGSITALHYTEDEALTTFFPSNGSIFHALGMLYLAATYPFVPGQRLYGLQDTAEQLRLRLAPGEERKADFALQLAERRLADLAHATGDRLPPALTAFDSAFYTALTYLEQIAGNRDMGVRLRSFLAQADHVLAAIERLGVGEAEDALVRALRATMLAFRESPDPLDSLASARPIASTLTEAMPIPFIGEAVDHSFFPLTGAHAVANCDTCHERGRYADTATECQDCHDLPFSMIYPYHFAGECETCHNTFTWTPLVFDHVGIIECESCHLKDEPSGHEVYTHLAPGQQDSWTAALSELARAVAGRLPGQSLLRIADADAPLTDELLRRPCMVCHTDTEDWTNYVFDHEGFDACSACHLATDAPDDHYDGECSGCHTTERWDSITFDHTGLTDCKSCHTPKHGFYPVPCTDCHTADNWWEVTFAHRSSTDCLHCHTDDRPAGHYTGQCSNCHTTGDWNAKPTDHAGLTDCGSCHSAPAGHYPGSCATCHTTESWATTNLSHVGLTDCASCHTYPGHYPGQCSNCHNTVTWGGAKLNHTGLVDCKSCHTAPAGHYAGQCSNCHTTRAWTPATFSHTGLVDCQSCHPAPDGHYDGQCSECHNTVQWATVIFNHSDLVDCGACHAAPTGHYPGQCSSCHNTLNWLQITFSHDGLTDCTGCHTPPSVHSTSACTACHNTSNWYEITTDHSASADCASCHPAPGGHWPGQCSDCHNTSDWWQVTFNHTGYTTCNACHPRPSGHVRGQCSRCHTTDTWTVPATPTPQGDHMSWRRRIGAAAVALGTIIGVTGSNGKTTTTALVAHLASAAGLRCRAAGNIGIPLIRYAGDSAPGDLYAVELSSFQLEAIDTFRPAIGAILNLTPDHLDRYPGFGEYVAAKQRLLMNQGAGDRAVLNADDPRTAAMAAAVSSRPVLFSRRRSLERGAFVRGGRVLYRDEDGERDLFPVEAVGLVGGHNLENVLAACAMAILAGVPAEGLEAGVRAFRGVEHRIEFVAELDGVRYYNDSKATNVDATAKALEAFPGNILLIAGGRDKEGDFASLRPLVRERVRRLVVIGEASDKLRRALADATAVSAAGSMEEAVSACRRAAGPGDVVLLAPACASFDMFRDYEERGLAFKEAVRAPIRGGQAGRRPGPSGEESHGL